VNATALQNAINSALIATGIDAPNSSVSGLNIFPNPASQIISVTFSDIIKKGVIKIYSLLDEQIFEQNILNQSIIKVNLKNITSGIYFVKVFDGEKSYCKKLIVE